MVEVAQEFDHLPLFWVKRIGLQVAVRHQSFGLLAIPRASRSVPSVAEGKLATQLALQCIKEFAGNTRSTA